MWNIDDILAFIVHDCVYNCPYSCKFFSDLCNSDICNLSYDISCDLISLGLF